MVMLSSSFSSSDSSIRDLSSSFLSASDSSSGGNASHRVEAGLPESVAVFLLCLHVEPADLGSSSPLAVLHELLELDFPEVGFAAVDGAGRGHVGVDPEKRVVLITLDLPHEPFRSGGARAAHILVIVNLGHEPFASGPGMSRNPSSVVMGGSPSACW